MSGNETSAELKQKLDEYNAQLQEVDELLSADPHNAEYLQIRTDLLEVIALTQDLYALKQAEEGGGDDDEELQLSAASVPDPAASSSSSAPVKIILPSHLTSGLVPATFFAVGTTCEARYSADNTWYKAVINNITEGCKYHVTYTEYGNSEVVSITDIRPLTDPSKKTSLLPLKRPAVPDSIQAIPKSLHILDTDSEEVKMAKKKKIKAIKSANRLKTMEEEGKSKKSAWQSFQNKPKKTVPMSLSTKKRESIFKSPDGGKIGVTGSGKPMTASLTAKDIFKQSVTGGTTRKPDIYMPTNDGPTENQ